MSREYIAKTLKRLREQSGLTADQVGELVGKSGKTVNAWENNRGQPDAEILIKLCDIYKVENILAEFRENDIAKAPAVENSEGDPQQQRLVNNYNSLNPKGKIKLVEYSDDLKGNPTYSNKTADTQPDAGANNSIAADEAATVRAANNAFIAVHTKQK